MRPGRSSKLFRSVPDCLPPSYSHSGAGRSPESGMSSFEGDRDNMVRRTLKVGRDSKPPCNRRSNGVLLVSIDEEMCPLRFQRQQRHVDHGQTHASATSSSARYYYIGIVNRVCDTSNRQRTESETTRGSYIHFRSEMNDVRMMSSRT